MTPDEFARAAYPLLHEGIVLLRAHAGEGPAIERYVTMVEKVRAQYRAAKEAPAPAPEPSAPPAGAPACKAWCGTSSSGDSPGDGCVVFTRVRRCFCSAACCNKLRPLNPPPSDPVTVATGGVPAGYRLGDGWTTSPPPRWTCTTESRCGDYAKYAHLNDPRDDGEGGPGACAVHAVSLGALVPIDTAAVPPGPVPETLDDLAARPSKTHAEASARAAAIVLGTPGPVAVEAAPVCKPDCGTAQWVPPGAPAIVTMWWCSDACGKAGRPLYRAPAPDRAPPPAAPASEPTVRPLSATDERDGLLRCRGCGGYRPDGNTCQCELAIARAEVEQLRGKLAEAEAQLDTARLVIADRNRDRDAARAEIERLRKRLPLDTGTATDTSGEVTKPLSAHLSEWAAARSGADPFSGLFRKQMREMAAMAFVLEADLVAARYHHDEAAREIAEAAPQADAIKVAVDKANNRAADAFRAWRRDARDRTPLGKLDGEQFEAWLRSGEDAPGAVAP